MDPPLTPCPSLPLVSTHKEKPRSGHYKKLMARFYESLFFLRVLGQTRDIRTSAPSTGSIEQDARRAFFRNLAFVCDYEKGGKSFTSFGVANLPDCYMFLLASKRKENCAKMLTCVLEMLREYGKTVDHTERAGRSSEFIKACIRHANSRIDLYIKELKAAIIDCIATLVRRNDSNGE